MTDAVGGAVRQPRLWIVDPSVCRAEVQGVARILDGWPGQSRVFRPGLEPGDGPGPELGHDADGVVVMGSAASVHDRADWISDLSAWLRPIVEGQVRMPLLGICFGHQLVAHLAGATVADRSSDGAKLVGIETTTLEGGRLLPGRRELRVVCSHKEEVRQAPPGFRIVARRPDSEVDGLEHADLSVFSYQFHPEAREEFARHAGLASEAIDAAVRRDGDELLAAFRQEALRHSALATSPRRA